MDEYITRDVGLVWHTTLTRIYVYRSVTYISWSNCFALYLEDYLMDRCHNWDIGSMWCKDLPHYMCVGQWPTFHHPVFLSYIINTTWWINVGDIDSVWHKHWTETIYVGQWPIFYGPVILPIYWKLLDGPMSLLECWIHVMQRFAT